MCFTCENKPEHDIYYSEMESATKNSFDQVRINF